MPWTIEQKLDHLLALPWTMVVEVTPEGDRILKVAEVPSASGSGETDAERETDLWDSLRESLRAYVHFGDTPPLPAGSLPPWAPEAAQRIAQPSEYVVIRRRQLAWTDTPEQDVESTADTSGWSSLPN